MHDDLESIRIAGEAVRKDVDLPIARPACWHNPLRDSNPSSSDSLYPTTMHGTRPEIAITYSPANKARHEAEYFAGLSYWGKLRYRLYEFLRRQAY